VETSETIRLRVGETREVELPGRGTSGYVWRVDPEPGPGLSIEKSTGAGKESGRGVGASTSEVFRITADQPGKSRARFVQSRPWEQGQAPLSIHVVDVIVEPG
jgi:predicted secreted protein